MTDICCGDLTKTICLKIVALPWAILFAKFYADISSNTKLFIQNPDLDRSVCMIVICYTDLIWTIFSDIVPLLRSIIHAEFRVDILSYKKVFRTGT